jgi:hypothetical protein
MYIRTIHQRGKLLKCTSMNRRGAIVASLVMLSHSILDFDSATMEVNNGNKANAPLITYV